MSTFIYLLLTVNIFKNYDKKQKYWKGCKTKTEKSEERLKCVSYSIVLDCYAWNFDVLFILNTATPTMTTIVEYWEKYICEMQNNKFYLDKFLSNFTVSCLLCLVVISCICFYFHCKGIK